MNNDTLSGTAESKTTKTEATETETTGPETADAFARLGLSQGLCRAVADAGYQTPTPIQQAAIPIVLDDQDLLGVAQTGSGKTAAFALPVLQCLMEAERPRGRHSARALVLAPTRELAAQIGDCFEKYSAGTGLKHAVVFGGVGKNPQLRALRQPCDVVIACPGRLLDLMRTEGIAFPNVEHLVLDEADRMLDMGFIRDVRAIIQGLPEDRQTLLFSATMPREVEQLARRILFEPKRVAVDPISSTAPPISQSVHFVEASAKQARLTALLKAPDIDRALVFTRTKHGANRVAQRLERSGIPAAAIHGNKSQGARERALSAFRAGDIRVVVATDLASRGIDVKRLSHVVNFELPNVPETYVHRVGRTGRAGETGTAISLCAPDERPYLRDIERLIGQPLARDNSAPPPSDSDEESSAGPVSATGSTEPNRNPPRRPRRRRRRPPARRGTAPPAP